MRFATGWTWAFLLSLVLAQGCAPGTGSGTTSGMLQVGADRLYYETRGSGYPLVLIGGGSGMDLRQWDAVAPRLAETFTVIRYDPRGVGRSDNPSVRYSEADDLETLVEDLGYKRVVAIGVSSAGGAALQFAAAHPDRVTAVVAVAPLVPGFVFDGAMQDRLLSFSQAAERGREPFLDAMFGDPHFMPAPLDAEIREAARRNMAENFDKGATVDPSLVRPPNPPLLRRLGELRVPVLLLAGALDHPEVQRRNEFLLTQITGSEERRVPDAGHNVPLENPQGFLDAALPFLDRIVPVGR